MLFLIHYDRAKGSLISIEEFPEKDMQNASRAKVDLEIALLDGAVGQEVVLLEANSLDDLKSTHRRYFDTFQEMRENSNRIPKGKISQGPSGRLNVRKATLLDVPAVQWLQTQVLPPGRQRDYAQHIGSPNCENFVACVGSEVVGYLSVLMTINNPSGASLWHRVAPYIGFVGVLPDHQKKGVCAALVGSVLDTLQSEGRPSILFVECPPDSCVIFEKLGFKKLERDYVQRTWGVDTRSTVMRLER